MSAPCVVWFRHDLRLADNPALAAAERRGGPIIPVFVWAPEEEGTWSPGAAARWWLHQSLAALDATLRRNGARLIVRRGPTHTALRDVVERSEAGAVFWNRRYEPAVISRDTALKTGLRDRGIAVDTFNAGLLFEPWTIRNTAGKPFQVFTPFWNACRSTGAPAPAPPRRARLRAPERWPESLHIADLGLEPAHNWTAGMRAAWTPGEVGADAELHRFLSEGLARYATDRDRPAGGGTSRLSPHLHFGEVSPRQVWHAVEACAALDPRAGTGRGAECFLRELGWREFAHHLLFHFAHTTDSPLQAAFDTFPWATDEDALSAWQRGRTGYPLVDAGMRELWTTGWMHNRVRMVVASFLVKDLLLPWHDGARWFWDTLVDADLANNTLGWQWTAGCGADAAPYFRVFNPVAQGEKFDPDGQYVSRWVPELSRLPSTWIHKPWQAPPPVLATAGVHLGTTYPSPIVDHRAARVRALAALATIKQKEHIPHDQ